MQSCEMPQNDFVYLAEDVDELLEEKDKRIADLEKMNAKLRSRKEKRDMSKRKQLNTDILLHITAQAGTTNILLLQIAKMERAERKICQDAIDHFTDISEKLVERSRKLDELEK